MPPYPPVPTKKRMNEEIKTQLRFTSPPRQILIGPLVRNCTEARLCFFMFHEDERLRCEVKWPLQILHRLHKRHMQRVQHPAMNHPAKLPHLPSGVCERADDRLTAPPLLIENVS